MISNLQRHHSPAPPKAYVTMCKPHTQLRVLLAWLVSTGCRLKGLTAWGLTHALRAAGDREVGWGQEEAPLLTCVCRTSRRPLGLRCGRPHSA